MSLQPSPGQLREAWEVGRLVLDPECRAGADLLSRCLFLTLLHLVDSVSIANIFATCTPVLARLYRRFGFGIVSSLAGEAQESFVLIHGDVPKVLTALARSAEEVGLAHKALARIDGSEQ